MLMLVSLAKFKRHYSKKGEPNGTDHGERIRSWDHIVGGLSGLGVCKNRKGTPGVPRGKDSSLLGSIGELPCLETANSRWA